MDMTISEARNSFHYFGLELMDPGFKKFFSVQIGRCTTTDFCEGQA